MNSKEERDRPFITVSWLKRLMIGENSCEWASWFKSHYQHYETVESDFDEVRWNMDHTRLLRDLRTEREGLGEKVMLETQNRFTYETSANVAISGTPDLIAITPDGEKATIFDAKTGRKRGSDKVQVMIYMHLLPLALPEYGGMTLEGVVAYQDSRVLITAADADASFVEHFENWVNIVSAPLPAPKVPSRWECRYCEISKSECPERIS